MKKVRRNATKKIERILKSAKKIEFFLHRNEYKGNEVVEGISDREIRTTIQDIELKHAHLFEVNENHFVVRYAGRARWEITL